MTLKSRILIDASYGADPVYSYWNGCSTGGRQGLMLVQRLPEAYDGVMAAAPAINWDRFIPAELWPQIIMKEEVGGPVAPCKLQLATAAAIEACDGLDGVRDGLIEDPTLCDFDASELVGDETDCGEFTAADARAINAIWDGARTADGEFLWYGMPRGAPLNALAGSFPFPIATDHVRFWVEQDPSFNWQSLDVESYQSVFERSQELFNDVIGTDDPDLRPFRDNGGKLLMWHGWGDQLIFAEGTIDYYERIIDTLPGNARKVGKFARLFMAPGVAHCGGGTGASSFDAFGALVEWVESGDAPDQIEAARIVGGETQFTRTLCPYPSVARYDGKGDPDTASSFDCRPNLGRWPNARGAGATR